MRPERGGHSMVKELLARAAVPFVVGKAASAAPLEDAAARRRGWPMRVWGGPDEAGAAAELAVGADLRPRDHGEGP
jgi:hypothetical protein